MSLVLQSKQPMLVAWGPELHSFYNDAFIPAVGAKHPASLGQPYAAIWAEVWDELLPLTEAVLRGEAQYFDDAPFALAGRAGRDVSWFSFSYTPLCDEQGVPAGFLVIAVETTDKVLLERRQAFRLTLEDLLRNLAHPREIMAAAAELLGRHLGAGRCGYGEVDETGEFVVLERDWTDGLMPSAAGRHRVSDFGAEFFAAYRAGQTIRIDDLHSDPRVAGTDVAAYSGLGGVRARLTVPLVKDGRFVASLYVHQSAPRRWTDEEAALVRDVAERTWAAVEQARAEAALRELNGTLERRVAERTAERDRLWRNSQDLLVVIDTAGVFLAVNPVVTAILGWAPEELVGRPLFDFIHPDDLALTAGALAHATLDALPVVENRYRHKDGTYRWLSWVAAPEDGLIYATARHVTAEREQAEALRQAEDALRQSQKMEAVGQLTGGLAHDFNNLLTGITGSLELLQTRVAQGRDQRPGALHRRGPRRVEAGRCADAPAAGLHAAADARSQAHGREPAGRGHGRPYPPHGRACHRGRGRRGWRAVGHPGRSEPARERIAESMHQRPRRHAGRRAADHRDREPVARPAWRARARHSAGAVCVAVRQRHRDGHDARGGPARLRPVLHHQAHWHGHRPGPVHDLRLRAAVRRPGPHLLGAGAGHDGVPLPSRGTSARRRPPSELAELAGAPRAEQGETVLVVDDEPTVRMLVAEVLEDLGYAAIEAADGASGLQVLRSDVRIDLLITDVGLPGGMNGRQVADAGRSVRPGLKVLFITGYAENAVVGNGHLDPGMHVLTKPFAMEALASRIRDIIANA